MHADISEKVYILIKIYVHKTSMPDSSGPETTCGYELPLTLVQLLIK